MEDQDNRVLSKKKLREILNQIHPSERLETDAEAFLLDLADEFVYSATKAACELAKHRHADRLDVKDLQLHLESMYNIRIPGYGSDDHRQVRRSNNVPQTHQQRLNQVRKAINAEQQEKDKERRN